MDRIKERDLTSTIEFYFLSNQVGLEDRIVLLLKMIENYKNLLYKTKYASEIITEE